MPILDDVRRWVKDRTTRDEYIEGTPSEKIGQLYQNLSHMTPSERDKGVEHIKAYATYYYKGHHNEPIPKEQIQQLYSLERRAHQLNDVDAARETLHRYGGPPTSDTIRESLERSETERQRMRESINPPEPQRETQVEAARERITEREAYRVG